MHIALRIGQHLAHELAMNRGQFLALPRRRRAKARPDLVGNRLPDGPLADGLDIAQHLVQHAVRLRAEGGPIGGIEGLAGSTS